MMKRELMRPELDNQTLIKFNYWDAGRKGLLSGEALYLDVKRMEMAYYEQNRREYELTKHISLRQLNPVALLKLKSTGACEVSIPEWLFDLDTPGHYMRRIKNVSLSIPAVTGPYTSINCKLTLLKSSIRTSPALRDDGYARKDGEDDRFTDFFGSLEAIVTSNAQNDSGMFETNLRDDRLLPFEGNGAISTWRLELPDDFRQFDYNSISDVILHMRYTARGGGKILKDEAISHLQEIVKSTDADLAVVFSLKHDFPTEWQRFVTSEGDFEATIKKEYFPYWVQDKKIEIAKVELYIQKKGEFNIKDHSSNIGTMSESLKDDTNRFDISFSGNTVSKDEKEAQVFLVIRYNIA